MKICVTGYKGRVGKELIKHGCLPLDCDITSATSVFESVSKEKPDVIINCAAKTDVDGCEKEIIQAYNTNLFAIEHFFPFKEIKFVQLSTDYIFDGLNGPYDENDLPNPICTYGFTKRFAESKVTEFPNSLIVRTTILYDNEVNNFVGKVIQNLSNKKNVRVPDSLFGNPTYVPHLVEGILSAIDKNITGTVNIAGDEIMSRYELACAIAKVFEFDIKLVHRGIAWGSAARPERAGFKLDKAKSLNIPIYTLWEGLLALRREKYGSKITLDNA